ncbi:MAG: polysaccharide biosynthesis protein, partial [Chloroflexota bacterium]
VPACEYNPFEAVQTNNNGAKNIIEAALDIGVSRVMSVSTDKAVNPANLYGATKLVAEKLFVQANLYSGTAHTRFSSVRYGNVMGSRGSVIPLFLKQRETGKITVTDERMTRFWVSLDQVTQFVISSIEQMRGGEIFIPKIPSMNIMDLGKAIAPDCEVEILGIRPGEKLRETLISEDEARSTIELEDRYVVKPTGWWFDTWGDDGEPLPNGFEYNSETNSEWLGQDDLMALLKDMS